MTQGKDGNIYMSNDNDQSASSTDQVPSGDLNKPNDPSGDLPNSLEGDGKKSVSYESYSKLLGQKKAAQEKLERLEAEAEARKRQELEATEKFKELYEGSNQTIEELKKQNEGLQTRWNNALKLNAFYDALGDGRKIDAKYQGFIDTENIGLDPETNKVDPVSVQKEVERITTVYPEIVRVTETRSLPTEAPNTPGTLSYEEWQKLPAAEMKKRRKEVRFK